MNANEDETIYAPLPRFTKRYLGPSSDKRTNRWKLTCKCGKQWEPLTTILAENLEECPKCNHSELVDYNA